MTIPVGASTSVSRARQVGRGDDAGPTRIELRWRKSIEPRHLTTDGRAGSALQVGRSLRRGCLEKPNQLTNRVMAMVGMAKRELVVKLVPVPASFPRLREVAGFLEVGDDVRRAPLGDSDDGGNVFEPQGRVRGDTREHVRVVGDEAPHMVIVARRKFHESLYYSPPPFGVPSRPKEVVGSA